MTPPNDPQEEALNKQDQADYDAAVKALRELGGWGIICIELEYGHVKEVKVTFSKRRKRFTEPRAP